MTGFPRFTKLVAVIYCADCKIEMPREDWPDHCQTHHRPESRMDESPAARVLLDLIAPITVISRHSKHTAEQERREHFRELIGDIQREARGE